MSPNPELDITKERRCHLYNTLWNVHGLVGDTAMHLMPGKWGGRRHVAERNCWCRPLAQISKRWPGYQYEALYHRAETCLMGGPHHGDPWCLHCGSPVEAKDPA